MKKTLAASAFCLMLGLAVGSASAGGKVDPMLQQSLGSLEAALQQMNGSQKDPHVKKSMEFTRKAIEEMREALGMHPITVIVALLVGATIAGLWGAIFVLPVIAVLNVFFNYVVNLRTLEEGAESPEEVIEEVRQESPDAPREELVALAAERVEEEATEIQASESTSES